MVRNSANALVMNTTIGMRISILHGSATGAPSYVELNYPQTNANGLVTIEVGSGTVVSGTFSNINWSAGPYYIKTQIDPAGGTNYTITSTSQLLSVPYALQARIADTATSLVTPAVPVGTILPFAGTTLPTGFMWCDGSAVSRTQYASLFGVIGNYWGSGDGLTTFNLPDMRGRFMRVVDGTAGRDPDKASRTNSNATGGAGNTGNAVGSAQEDQVKSHNHDLVGALNFAGTIQVAGGSNAWAFYGGGTQQSVANSTGSESRPINVYVNYIIKI